MKVICFRQNKEGIANRLKRRLTISCSTSPAVIKSVCGSNQSFHQLFFLNVQVCAPPLSLCPYMLTPSQENHIHTTQCALDPSSLPASPGSRLRLWPTGWKPRGHAMPTSSVFAAPQLNLTRTFTPTSARTMLTPWVAADRRVSQA
jgi:hypothetical protein